MKELLKSYYQFSDYQIAQLGYFFKTVLSEISKILMIGFIFRKEPDIYCIAMLSLCLLRTSTGGLHCKTYASCLLASTCYLVIAIKILPLSPVPSMMRIILLTFCALVNYIIGPVTSDVRKPLKETIIQKSRLKAALFILLFTLLTIVIPENVYMIPIFWITIIHTLQLILAKIKKRKKGGTEHETEAH